MHDRAHSAAHRMRHFEPQIEGRAKSAYYVACVTNAYRHGIDAVMNGEPPSQWVVDERRSAIARVQHRVLQRSRAGADRKQRRIHPRLGCWWPCTGEENGMMRLSQRNRFFRGETVSVLEPGEVPYDLTLSEIYNEDMEPIESAPHGDDDGLP